MHISYTNQAENAIKYAAKKAKEMQHPYIGTEHLLLGLRQEYSGVAGQILARNGVEEKKIYQLMDELIVPQTETPVKSRPAESPRYKDILENSAKEAHRLHTTDTGTEASASVDDPGCGLCGYPYPDHTQYQSPENLSGYYDSGGCGSERVSG